MDSALTTIGLPLALGIIMLGLGLSLTVRDFTRLLSMPWTIVLVLGCQIVLLPLFCLGLVLVFVTHFDLSPLLAVGMMMMAASPGGTTASLYSYLFKGNVALNISLTAINSLTAMVTLPLITGFSLGYFTEGGSIGLQTDKMVQVFAVILIPVAIGMLVRAKLTAFAERMEKPVKLGSILVLVAVIVGAIAAEWANLPEYIVSVGLMVLVFNVVSLVIGYWAPRLVGTERPEAVASCMEIGLHNTTLSLTIAVTVLNSTEIAIPSAVYGVLMFFTAAAAGALLNRRGAREDRAGARAA
ncbi:MULTISPECIES: bile acid:sodium symporter family protein [unclassified Nocardiopsis]|uniref:bile acid:sodium symporter family protein n=1 Tax=unclassified Nocardiopsis TaxID=2649073 RepID=UPI00066C4CFC|nr:MULTISPECIES: bile acid:sodium symporter family protein [unclassified Nocardiopsis]MBQ1081676.1 bile acid:sodium symporter family protein [Nocardiopsis sp. B62]